MRFASSALVGFISPSINNLVTISRTRCREYHFCKGVIKLRVRAQGVVNVEEHIGEVITGDFLMFACRKYAKTIFEYCFRKCLDIPFISCRKN